MWDAQRERGPPPARLVRSRSTGAPGAPLLRERRRAQHEAMTVLVEFPL
jgi:hypothetical protein